ncbi:MAG: amidohydrolase family protein [Phycisphaerae bacterium]|nr:amidohydrolase family protein [Phycisphaerae bacterium]
MIIDCHSHIWPSIGELGEAANFSCLSCQPGHKKFDVHMGSPDRHRKSAEHTVKTLVLGFTSNLLGAQIPNQFISDYVASQPERLLGFAGIDPTIGAECLQEIHLFKQNPSFSGLVLCPPCQGFHPCDTRALRVYELAESLKMPIYFLYGGRLPRAAILDYAQPAALDEVARGFPNLKIVISHLGFPWIEQTIVLLAKHKNIFADVAGLTDKPWQAYRSLNLAYEYGIIDKLLFASDFPTHTVKTAAETLYNLNKITLDSVLPAVPLEQLRGIVERDSLALLGLKNTKPQE